MCEWHLGEAGERLALSADSESNQPSVFEVQLHVLIVGDNSLFDYSCNHTHGQEVCRGAKL
jgi:hypothetical protein